jgi:hypothetical protein
LLPPLVPLLELLMPPLAPLLEPPLLLFTVSTGGPPPLPPDVGGVSEGHTGLEVKGVIVPCEPPGLTPVVRAKVPAGPEPFAKWPPVIRLGVEGDEVVFWPAAA